MLKKVIILSLAVLISIYAGEARAGRVSRAEKTASKKDLTKELVKTDSFLLTAYHRFKEKNDTLRVYIEGDGRAWVKKRLSHDPTPKKPFVLILAGMDPSDNVVYIARPCQYTPRDMEPLFDSVFWSDKRFSEPVILSVNQAINKYKADTGAEKIELVGYSGGAAVAVLAASRRNDVTRLITIAGNLDPDAVNKHHRVTPMTGSLDPLDEAHAISNIPQSHFIGDKDRIVPRFISENFISHLNNNNSAEVIEVEGCTHTKGWIKKWKNLLSALP